MAVIETWFEQDLQKPVKVRYIDGNLFSHNGNGNRIGVVITNNGEPVTLTGTVSGYAVLADGTTVPCTGSRSGNKASILVPAAAYSPGSILISIFLTDGTTVTTLAALSSSVIMARTGNQIDPGSVVTDWTNTINAAMQSVETAAANLGNIIATPYANLTFPVPLGKYTIYNNGLYRCISPIASSEAWTAAHWTNVKLGDDVADLKSAISTYDYSIEKEYTSDGKTVFQYKFEAGKTYILHQYSVIAARYSICNASGSTITDIKNTTPAAEYEMEYTAVNNGDYFYCTATGDVHFTIYEKGLLRQEFYKTQDEVATLQRDVEDITNDYYDVFYKLIDSTGAASAYNNNWRNYVYSANNIKRISKIIAYSSTISDNAVTFYNSSEISASTFISRIRFGNIGRTVIENIIVPDNTVTIVISTRIASSTEFAVYGYAENEIDKITAINDYIDHANLLDHIIASGNGYINNNGSISTSSSWTYYELDATKIRLIKELVSYTNSASYLAVGFYAGSTFIGGITYSTSSKSELNDIPVPNDATIIKVASRTATNKEFVVNGTVSGKLQIIKTDVENIAPITLGEMYRNGTKKIFAKDHSGTNIPNSNDFTFVGDEIWFSSIIDNDAGTLNINRRKIVNDKLSYVGTFTCDFGHFNTVDYNYENNCLVFGNGGNGTSTEGNWFAIVKNPLALSGSASLAENATVFNVDIGFKVQAVWGDSNLGKNNIVILFSSQEHDGNTVTRITKVLLEQDNNGDFTGNYTVIGTHYLDELIGVGGGDFCGDTLYIGMGTEYGIAKVNMTDYSVKKMTRQFFDADGTEYVGVTQGVHVDNKYLWWFVNVGGSTECYLMQNYIVGY